MRHDSVFPSRRGGEQVEPSVLVTGLCGRLGKRVVRRLHREHRVVGIDRRPFPDRPRDVKLLQFDMRRKKTRDVFRAENIQAVVHLGVLHNPRDSVEMHHEWNVVGFQKLLEYAAAFRVPKVVVLSSANVYGPRPDNPQFLTEENPLLGGVAFSEIRDLIEVDMLAQSFFWRHPETETVILRPVHILGSVRNAASNYLRLRTAPTVMGFDPMVQVVHEDDVVQAIERALRPGVRGIFNVAGPSPLPLSHLLKLLGRTRLPVPHSMLKPAIEQMFRLHLTSFPAPELDHIRYVCMVDDSRAREQLGYTPLRSIEETAFAVEEGRWW
jgi:UDP-glucose 4-epimerase